MKGSVTVYLTLSLGVLLSLVMTLVGGAYRNTIRCEGEMAVDTAMYSALAEYHREMWERYDLLLVDMSYGCGNPTPVNLQEHIREYVNRNLPDTSLLSAEAGQITMDSYAAMADEAGEGLKKEIILAEKELMGVEELEQLVGWTGDLFQSKDSVITDMSAEWEQNQNTIASTPNPKKKTGEHKDENTGEMVEDFEEIPIENPGANMFQKKTWGLAAGLLPNDVEISKAIMNPDACPSLRVDKVQGTGVASAYLRNENLVTNIAEEALYQKYLFDHMGRYGAVLQGSQMQYELEYILFGLPTDEENLNAVVNRLLIMREAANVIYLRSDPQKMAEINGIATGLSAVMAAPELQQVIATSILFAWAFLESMLDVKGLLAGDKVPLQKTAASFQSSLSNAIAGNTLGSYQGDGSGLDYAGYLQILLMLESPTLKLARTMDIMEMDMRLTSGNEAFRLDGCVNDFSATVEIESAGGYRLKLTREYGYY